MAELAALTFQAAHEKTQEAQEYLTLGRESAAAALAAMETLREQRRAAEGRRMTGQTSDQDQDLLRAMVVFACAGLDAAMKRLILDALPDLATRHEGVQKKLTQFTERMLSDGGGVSAKSLASLLTRDIPPREAVIESYLAELTGGSLQSADALHETCGALGVDDAGVRTNVSALQGVFRARNQIIHELDMAASDQRRRRRHRAIKDMVRWASQSLTVGQAIVDEVSRTLNAGEPD